VNLTEDQILTLAPDESSKKAGKDLANPSKWIIKGFSQEAIWGECQDHFTKTLRWRAFNSCFKLLRAFASYLS
jgi:hypothetical protein